MSRRNYLSKMDKYQHSSYLFFDGGNPMRFSMHPCKEREKLKPVVEHGGARITSKPTRGTIRLVTPGTIVNTDNCVYSKWIWDCVEQNKKIPIDSYKVKTGRLPSLKRKQPRLYSADEDFKLIHYVLDKNEFHSLGGNQFWQKLEAKKIVNRTCQSTKERFFKHILHNTKKYKIENKYKECLRRLLSFMCIEHDSSTDISDDIDEIKEEIVTESPKIEPKSPKIESKSPKIESKSPKIESKSPKIELRSTASKECNVETRNESESSDLELRIKDKITTARLFPRLFLEEIGYKFP